ncbi:hypothetical protein HDU98_008024 [Podochytrium sp. JEL0797]|nr:hypothetical protein HDU98_008024 [Podochytrium sp. JEL0797]
MKVVSLVLSVLSFAFAQTTVSDFTADASAAPSDSALSATSFEIVSSVSSMNAASSTVASVPQSANATITSITPTATPTGTPAPNGSLTSFGSGISIISPLTGSTYRVGQMMQITWSLTGNPNDAFNKANISFEINEVVDENNVFLAPNGALSFKVQPVVGDLTAETSVPNITSGKKFTVKGVYKDTSNLVFWYSPTFSIEGTLTTAEPHATVSSIVKSTSVTSVGFAAKISAAVAVSMLFLF